MQHMQWVLIFAVPVSLAAEVDGFISTLGQNPSPEEFNFYFFRQMSMVIHGRFTGLMDAVTTLRGTYRSAWLDEYTDDCLGAELGRWDAESEYWRRFQARLTDVTQNFKKGDTLPALDELRPHF